MDSAQSDLATPARHVSPEEAEVLRKMKTQLLARARLLDQIRSCEHPRYREMMEKALADLEKSLAQLH
ncbi:MAG: hypothetical protein LAN62_04260 [Acidobacteriia bacterium]|nr:hypothetical protein [Terriglobia bacterium]